MKVINVAGFPVKFEKEGRTYSVPNDNQLHMIPDKCYFEDNFQGLLRVIVPPTEVHQVTRKMNNNKTRRVDINDPTIKEIVLDKIEEKKKKPLAGKRLKPAIRKKLRKTNKKKTEDDE